MFKITSFSDEFFQIVTTFGEYTTTYKTAATNGRSHHIDELDRKILALITKNARIPYLEVARECKVSGAAIHQRIQRLTKMGVITGSEFIISPKKIGFLHLCLCGNFPGQCTSLSRSGCPAEGDILKLLSATISQEATPSLSRSIPGITRI